MAQQLDIEGEQTEEKKANRSIIANGRKVDLNIIRTVCVGSSGVGKSSLCNLLSDSNVFEVNDEFDSCTQQTKSKGFTYSIGDTQYHYQITDCEGFFSPDTILDKCTKIEDFLNIIKKCTSLTSNGITAILLLIPVGRLLEPYIESIKFMQKYFGDEASKHIILVFSKAKDKSVNVILQRMLGNKNQNKYANKLVLDYLYSIDNKCVATECEQYVQGNTERCRRELLCEINKIHQKYGICDGNVMLRAFEKLQCDIRSIKAEQVRKRVYKVAGFVMFAGLMGMSYKYRNVNARLAHVISEREEVSAKLGDLILNYGPMISEIFSKMGD